MKLATLRSFGFSHIQVSLLITMSFLHSLHNELTFAVAGSPATNFILSTPKMQDPPQISTINYIKHCFQRCEALHEGCSLTVAGIPVDTNPILPTRIVSVKGDPRLIITKGERGRYFALSHCWGRSQQSMTTCCYTCCFKWLARNLG